jgi:hypothetical protein
MEDNIMNFSKLLSVTKKISQKGKMINGKGPIYVDPLEILQAYFDYKKYEQESQNYREELWVKRDVAIKTLESQKDLILRYFDNVFAERGITLNKFFDILSSGVKFQNDKMIDVALTGILGVIKDNPLKAINSFKENFNKPNNNLEF